MRSLQGLLIFLGEPATRYADLLDDSIILKIMKTYYAATFNMSMLPDCACEELAGKLLPSSEGVGKHKVP